MSSIYFIRHGQASFGSDNYDVLSPLGRHQAGVLGGYLRKCGIHFDAIYSGDLQRQRSTAELAVKDQPKALPLQVDPRFNDVRNNELFGKLTDQIADTNPSLKDWVSKSWVSSKDYQKAFEVLFNHWASSKCTHKGIQSWGEYSGLVRDAVLDVMHTQGSGRTVGVFTSGGTIATIVTQTLGLSGEHTYRFFEPMINCSVTRLFYSGNKVSLSYFNDHSFLDLLGQQQGEQLVTYR